MSIDYERAIVLMDFIEAASKHGPAYNVLVGEASAELKAMTEVLSKEVATRRVKEKEEAVVKAAADARRSATLSPTDPGRLTEAEIARIRTDPSEPVLRDQPNLHSTSEHSRRSQAEIDSANRAAADRDNAHRNAEAQRQREFVNRDTDIDRRSV